MFVETLQPGSLQLKIPKARSSSHHIYSQAFFFYWRSHTHTHSPPLPTLSPHCRQGMWGLVIQGQKITPYEAKQGRVLAESGGPYHKSVNLQNIFEGPCASLSVSNSTPQHPYHLPGSPPSCSEEAWGNICWIPFLAETRSVCPPQELLWDLEIDHCEVAKQGCLHLNCSQTQGRIPSQRGLWININTCHLNNI